MKVLIDGPRWTGQWTEVIADAFAGVGHAASTHYHNTKSIGLRLRRLLGADERALLLRRSSRELKKVLHSHTDLLLSIQGKLDAGALTEIRRENPRLAIWYWWGDVLNRRSRERLLALAAGVDRLLISYLGDYQSLEHDLGAKAVYFPFGISPGFHQPAAPASPDTDVVFVGTCYPRRLELIRHLNRHLASPVRVFGRGWQAYRDIAAGRGLDLAATQNWHARARIALNILHPETNNGYNMKYYEIPAAGSLQIASWQPLADHAETGRGVVTFKDADELLAKVRFYLANPDARQARADQVRRTMFERDTYAHRLRSILA